MINCTLTLDVQLNRLAETIAFGVASRAHVLAHPLPRNVLKHQRLIRNNDSLLRIILKLIIIILRIKKTLRLIHFPFLFAFSRKTEKQTSLHCVSTRLCKPKDLL